VGVSKLLLKEPTNVTGPLLSPVLPAVPFQFDINYPIIYRFIFDHSDTANNYLHGLSLQVDISKLDVALTLLRRASIQLQISSRRPILPLSRGNGQAI
jgi:hypothetical protein